MPRTNDPAEISAELTQIKQATENGYYAPVVEMELATNGSGETLDITLDYPDAGDEVFSLSVPQYWESDRTLPSVLDALDVPVEDMAQLENRSVPVKRVNGSWEVDMTRLNNGDYIEGSDYTQ
ncbi:hypothetical protein M199_gp266 [Halogranum tailed virus 1]|uniref:Uncharacterized protein n=1 Tax=Halogranum tailed virus 1 TaxID=1273749 RepID=R4T942_9CAUD|nr:hypothetical protein M199_gp266 [Halogranum tailed virus 1]AGM11400.1 hypothetical protein HGTV1_98 [Halogranum tailed virus 1]